jgi:hypothetical protein
MTSCSQNKSSQEIQTKKKIEPEGDIALDTTYTLKLNQSLPFYRIRLVEGEDTAAEIQDYYKIKIQHGSSDSIIQTIIGEFPSIFHDEYPDPIPDEPQDIEFVDLNFDGFLDIKKADAVSANGMTVGYSVYLFNPWDKLFYHNNQISTILGGSYYSLNPTDSTIFSAGETGCMGHCFSRETYKVVHDSLVLIRREQQTREYDGNQDIYIRTEEELVNGVLTIVSKDTVDD